MNERHRAIRPELQPRQQPVKVLEPKRAQHNAAKRSIRLVDAPAERDTRIAAAQPRPERWAQIKTGIGVVPMYGEIASVRKIGLTRGSRAGIDDHVAGAVQ